MVEPPATIAVSGLVERVVPAAAHRRSCVAQVRAGALGGSTTKPPLDIVAAVDCSSSMSGAIDLLRQALYFVVDELRPIDRLGIVVYGTEVTVALSLRLMDVGGRAAARAAIAGAVHAHGSTNLSGGILAGLAELLRRGNSTGEGVPRSSAVIVMTDGHPTCGICDGDELLQAVNNAHAQMMPTPPPIYSFGFGGNHDSAMLHRLADAAQGMYGYIEHDEMISSSFAECLGGLTALVAQNLRLELHTGSGARFHSIVTTYRELPPAGSGAAPGDTEQDGNAGDVAGESKVVLLVTHPDRSHAVARVHRLQIAQAVLLLACVICAGRCICRGRARCGDRPRASRGRSAQTLGRSWRVRGPQFRRPTRSRNRGGRWGERRATHPHTHR